jgi:dTDP-glucose 4,6-dehydratase
MKTILVTGGAGFIGSNFVRYLHKKYPTYKIIVVDALTYAGHIENLPEDIIGGHHEHHEFWYGNVRNGELMDTLVSRSDVVVHMAAESHVTRSIYDNQLFFETDVLGTQCVANAVTKFKDRVERFIHISTSEVYGTALKEKICEDHPLNPQSPYASAKCGADRLVYSYWKTYNIPAVIVRPFNNYGPYQHLEKVVSRFITSCILEEPLRVHGDGSAARDFLYVEDHCEALDKIIHIDRNKVVGEVINLGVGQHYSIIDIAETVIDILRPKKSPIQFVGDRPGQVYRHTADTSKAENLLGWGPKMDFRDGIRDTADWFVRNEKHWRLQKWMRHIPIITASGKREIH